MKLIFIGGLFSEEQQKNIYKNSKTMPNMAANVHQWNIINGLKGDVDIINPLFLIFIQVIELPANILIPVITTITGVIVFSDKLVKESNTLNNKNKIAVITKEINIPFRIFINKLLLKFSTFSIIKNLLNNLY